MTIEEDAQSEFGLTSQPSEKEGNQSDGESSSEEEEEQENELSLDPSQDQQRVDKQPGDKGLVDLEGSDGAKRSTPSSVARTDYTTYTPVGQRQREAEQFPSKYLRRTFQDVTEWRKKVASGHRADSQSKDENIIFDKASAKKKNSKSTGPRQEENDDH